MSPTHPLDDPVWRRREESDEDYTLRLRNALEALQAPVLPVEDPNVRYVAVPIFPHYAGPAGRPTERSERINRSYSVEDMQYMAFDLMDEHGIAI